MPLRHLTFYQGQDRSELSGCVDVGTPARYHLARIHMNLRSGHEGADLDTILRLLHKHRATIASKFATPVDDLLGPEPTKGTRHGRR